MLFLTGVGREVYERVKQAWRHPPIAATLNRKIAVEF